jgi:siroheme synthase-like protein
LFPANMTSTRPRGDAFCVFSLALRVTGRPCLVVGGGAVAARKVAALLEAGALVEVVAPELGPELAAQRRAGASWRWMAKPFSAADAAGCLLVIAATDDRQVNRRVAEAAREQRALVNVVDAPEDSDFFVPSVLRRGPLHFAVTTSGLAPAVSARLRHRLEELFPEEWGDAVALIGGAREEARDAGLDESERRALARELAALDIEGLLAEGGLSRVEEAVRSCTSPYLA